MNLRPPDPQSVTHDVHGGLTGHPDHLHTHRVTMLAAQAPGPEQLYPDAGTPWQPRALYLATHSHSVVPALSDAIGARKAVDSVPDEHVTGRAATSLREFAERSSQVWAVEAK